MTDGLHVQPHSRTTKGFGRAATAEDVIVHPLVVSSASTDMLRCRCLVFSRLWREGTDPALRGLRGRQLVGQDDGAMA
jgi:hypothetical protein